MDKTKKVIQEKIDEDKWGMPIYQYRLISDMWVDEILDQEEVDEYKDLYHMIIKAEMDNRGY